MFKFHRTLLAAQVRTKWLMIISNKNMMKGLGVVAYFFLGVAFFALPFALALAFFTPPGQNERDKNKDIRNKI